MATPFRVATSEPCSKSTMPTAALVLMPGAIGGRGALRVGRLYSGRAKARMTSPERVPARGVPPAAITTYCRPLLR